MSDGVAEAVLVTGASGGLGSRIVRRLLDRQRPRPVVALCRDPDRMPALDGGLDGGSGGGVHVRRGDYEDPRSLREALVGVGTLVFVSSDGDRAQMWRHHQNVVTEAARAGIDRIVYTSILDIDPASRFYYEPVHRRTEALVADACRAGVVVRASVFTDFFVAAWAAEAIQTGVLAVPAGSGRVSFVTRDDVAATVARLADPSVDPILVQATGPAALDMTEVAAVLARISGRPVAYRPPEPADYAAGLRARDTPDWLVEAFTSFFAAIAEQRFATVSGDCRRELNRQPTGFAAYAAAALSG